MAAPANVRVESNSTSTTILRWTYAGAAAIAVYRSTDGSSYSEITTTTAGGVARVPVGTLEFTDATVAQGVKYWYKLSDDVGSTFSSVVIVVTQTCVVPSRVAGDNTSPLTDVSVTQLEDMRIRLEEGIEDAGKVPQPCLVCPVDGAVVIDCSGDCKSFVIVVTEDINSMSMNWCEETDPPITLLVPPGTTRRICGFPAGFGASGDECFQAPISGGASGRSVPLRGSSKPGVQPATPTGGGGKYGPGCSCVPNGAGDLKIQSCNPNNSLKCSTTKSLNVIACGGVGPYLWSVSGAARFKEVTDTGHPDGLHTSVEGPRATLVPPANTGSGVAGTAYEKRLLVLAFSAGTVAQAFTARYGCNDAFISATLPVSSCTCNGGSCPATFFAASGLDGSDIKCDSAGGTCAQTCGGSYTGGQCCPGTDAALAALASKSFDVRTAPMISGGCNPCGLSGGTIVTVTDATGASVSIVLTA